MTALIYALLLVAALLAAEGLLTLYRDRQLWRRASTRKRLREMTRELQAPSHANEESLLKGSDTGSSLLEQLVDELPGREQLELKIYRSGLTMTPERFVVMCGALAFAGWFLGAVFFGDLVKSLLLTGVGVLPFVHLNMLENKRLGQFEKQFPDALDLLIRALRAGHSLSTGFGMVGKELPDPIGAEFGQVADEVHLGKTMPAALANLAYRVNSPDLPFFVTAINIQQETGSNLAEVLENLSTVMRDRFKLLGKVRALTAMGRGSANLLACWPIVTVAALYGVNPDYVAPLWEEDAGHMMVMISACMVIFGWIVCRKMATIRV